MHTAAISNSTVASRSNCCVRALLFPPAMAAPPTRKVQVSNQLKDHKARLDAVEERLHRVELVQEQQEGYRRLRVEHGDKVKQVWEKIERKEIDGRDLKAEIARALAEDVQSSLLQPTDPEALEQKARTLSNNKRGALPQTDREHLVRDMDITAHLEWVRKDKSGAIALILKRGEPSRLYFERIKHDGNWALFVASRMQEPPKGIQIYPDRGPLSRRKGQGKGKGGAASGSRRRGKGKGKGRKGNH